MSGQGNVEDSRELPKGWVKQYNQQYSTHFYVNTLETPPRSSWTHPADEAPQSKYAPPPGGPPGQGQQGQQMVQQPQYQNNNQYPQQQGYGQGYQQQYQQYPQQQYQQQPQQYQERYQGQPVRLIQSFR
jgi:hypothetical protein